MRQSDGTETAVAGRLGTEGRAALEHTRGRMERALHRGEC